MRPPPFLLSTLLVMATLACDPGIAPPGTETGTGEPLASQDPALGWLGTFRGAGGGTVAGKEVRWSDIALVVRFDDTEAAGCRSCLTLTLGDTLFRAMNVRPASAVELEVAREDPHLRSLRLHRYSGSGGTGNIVEAELTVADSLGVVLEALFVLAR